MRLTSTDDDGTSEEAPGLSSCYARSKRVNPVRYDVDANGFCLHHNNIQILRQSDNGNWATVRKKCPECIKEDCPVMLGGEVLISNETMVEQTPRYTSLRSLLQRPLSESTLSSMISTSDLIEDADNNGLEILLRRPDRISVSIWSPSERRDEKKAIDYRSTMLEGVQFCSTHSGEIAIHAIKSSDSSPILQCVNACSLMEGSNHASTFFDLGDVLEYACGVELTSPDVHDDLNFTTSGGIVDETAIENSEIATDEPVVSNNDATEYLKNKFRQLSSDKFDKTLCISTNTSRENSVRLCQAIVLFPRNDDVLESDKEVNCNYDTALGRSDIDSVCFDIGIIFSQRDERLIIGSVRNIRNGWLNSPGCAIKEGDVVVGINEYITSTMSPAEARQIVYAIVSSRTTYQLSITTINGKLNTNASTRWNVVRKSVVGAVGGTLAASGAVLMVTPLHPIGHMVALGGVAVLATEFEAPRKAMVNAKHRFSEGMLKFNDMRRSRKSNKEGSCEEGSVSNN